MLCCSSTTMRIICKVQLAEVGTGFLKRRYSSRQRSHGMTVGGWQYSEAKKLGVYPEYQNVALLSFAFPCSAQIGKATILDNQSIKKRRQTGRPVINDGFSPDRHLARSWVAFRVPSPCLIIPRADITIAST